MEGSMGSRTGVRRPSGAAQQPEPSALSRIPLSVITLVSSIGVLISCYAYNMGRVSSYPNPENAVALYWVGQVFILLPIGGRLISRRPLNNGAIITLIAVLTTAEYLLKCAYEPLGFAFNDEFLHWRGTTDMLQSGKLFELNYGLPIGTHYPGIEEVTSALISATGLSVFEAGLVVAGIAHLLYLLFLYMLFVVAIRSHRIAGIAVLIYFSAPSLTGFNSMFVYETLALAFMGMALVAGLRSAVEKSPVVRRRWFVVSVLSILATVVTHHVTSYMLTAFLFLVAIASQYTGSRNTAKRFWLLAFISLGAVILWIATIARDTLNYFAPTVTGITGSIQQLINGGSSQQDASANVASSPKLNILIEGGGLLILTVLITIGVWTAWKRHRKHPWIMGMTLGASLGWMLSLGIRFGTSDGQELYGRAATYLYIPVAVIAALALTKLVNDMSVRRFGKTITALVVVAAVGLIIDGISNGWPPYWERLPGPHQVAAFEASVDPEEVNISYASLKELGPGNVFASDAGIYPVLIGYGEQNPQQLVTFLYSTPSFFADVPPAVNPNGPTAPPVTVNNLAQAEQIDFVETDTRTTKLPMSPNGSYFPDQQGAQTPVVKADIAKYDHIPGVAQVYDDGTIRIYNLWSMGYVPQP
jgi:hypothetical protein